MSTFSTRLQEAMDLANIKQAELSEKTGIGKSSISQYLSGLYEPKQKNIYLIATALNVDPAFLMGIDNSNLEKDHKISLHNEDKKSTTLPPLTTKDELSIQKRLESILNDLMPGNSAIAYYDGEEPMSDEDKELIRISLENTMRLAKQMAKQKFTPKKYRK